MRCFLGGARDEAVLSLSDDDMLATVRAELKKIVKLEREPDFRRVYRWRGAMAQYESGHIARVERIEKRVADIKHSLSQAMPFMASACPIAFAAANRRRTSILGTLRRT